MNTHPPRRPRAGLRLAALRAELAPKPGRAKAAMRMLIACLLIITLSMALRLPNAALSAYMVFFVSRDDMATTAVTGVALIAAMTVAIGLTLLAYMVTIDAPALRLGLMTLLFGTGMYLSRVFVAGPIGFGLGFILLITQSTVDLYPAAEPLVRDTLWIWMAVSFSITIVVVLNVLLWPASGAHRSQKTAQTERHLFVADALSNPMYQKFALKTTFAAMLCYIFYTAWAWPGIHTCVITCAVVALTSTGATLHKARLRIAGALVGGALALLVTVFIVPHLESLGGLLVTIAPVVASSAWIAAGDERSAYLGWQIAFAFFLCILHGFGPNTDVTLVRDRLVGILLGITVMSLMFRLVWPEHAEARDTAG